MALTTYSLVTILIFTTAVNVLKNTKEEKPILFLISYTVPHSIQLKLTLDSLSPITKDLDFGFFQISKRLTKSDSSS